MKPEIQMPSPEDVVPTDIGINALDGPAVYANRLVIRGGGVVVISFLEQFQDGHPAHFRSAVVLPPGVAMQLAQIIHSRLEQDAEDMRVPAMQGTTK